MPAVTTKLERTKEDMRNGSITGSPVSAHRSVFPLRCQKLPRKQRTRMYRSIHDLLRMPQLRRHLPNLAQLIIRNQLLRVLQPLLRYQQHPTTLSVSQKFSSVVHSLPKPARVLVHEKLHVQYPLPLPPLFCFSSSPRI